MTRLGWQVRDRPSGDALYRQRVTVTGAADVMVKEPAPGEAALHALMDHTDNCTACHVRTDGGFCQAAAELVRAERKARR
ncbi:hypothetical protein [Streptomyces sp. NBC_01506]|uniref:hypothetical protein n=1 Tax=Streptomyces sp. NBC_01506 TaxID=2903887 RepID=UPI003863282A